ncbi:hypothetical protein MTIM_07710 [Mycobacterium timonense]|uniref:Uncharacterized protein n=1 Tax=Mycobacterium timonense TaxID=701043 RepID=A0A7I9Z218_9MYCO|nr:hypothetical protein MTIM_07710 [Mycobacterium timonense]
MSISSLAGTARTLVAVGTSSDADMFLTTAAAAPRSVCNSSPSAGGGVAAFAGAGRAGTPLPAAVLTGGVVLAGGAGLGVGGAAGAGFAGAGAAAARPSPLVAEAGAASLVGSGL